MSPDGTPAPGGGLGAITFLEILGFLPDALPTEEAELERPVLATAIPVETSFQAPRTAPKQIADAVIRSMLKGVEPLLVQSAVAETPLPDVAAPEVAAPEIAAVPLRKSEDWDVPLDWSAPEELVEADAQPDELPVWSPLPITPVGQATAPAPTPRAAESDSGSIVARQATPPIVDRAPVPLASRAPETAAPLAFAMKLSVIGQAEEPPPEVAKGEVPSSAVASAVKAPAKSLPPAIVAASPLAIAKTETLPPPKSAAAPIEFPKTEAPLRIAPLVSSAAAPSPRPEAAAVSPTEFAATATPVRVSPSASDSALFPSPELTVDGPAGFAKTAAPSAVPARIPQPVVPSVASRTVIVPPLEVIKAEAPVRVAALSSNLPAAAATLIEPVMSLPQEPTVSLRQPATSLPAVEASKQTTAPSVAVDVSADQQPPDQREPRPSAAAKPERADEPKSPPRTEPVMRIPMPTHPDAASPAIAVPVRTAETPSGGREAISMTNAPPSAQQPADEPPPQAIRSNATHEIAVRISAPDAAPVDLQVKERAGTVHVAVRTADGGLQTALRQDLGTLVDRLEHSGFRAETTVTQELPARARVDGPPGFDLTSAFRTHAMAQTGGSGSNSDQAQDGDPARQQNHASDFGGRQQQQRRQNNPQHLKWMQATEDQE